MSKISWPLMLKSSHEAVRAENYLLRDALREANAELRKHRMLIANLRDGNKDTADTLARIFAK